MVENQSEKKIKRFRTDRGGEYLSTEYKQFLEHQGIFHEVSMAGTPQNGVAERLNRTLQENARSMMLSSGLHGRFWGEAIVTACYLRNRSPSSVKGGQNTGGSMEQLETIHWTSKGVWVQGICVDS